MGKKRLIIMPPDPEVKLCACGRQITFVRVPRAGGKPGQTSWMPLSMRTATVRDGVRMAEPHFADCSLWTKRRRQEAIERAAGPPTRIRPWSI